MKKLFGLAILGLASVGPTVHAANPETRLVVGIVVDQLRTDYLRQLSPLFGQGGFNRLMKDGVFIPDVNFRNTVADQPTGTAVIFTGAWPAFNGVPSANVYDETLMREVPVLGTGTGKSIITPEGLQLSTIADEIAINGGGSARIYSIAADPQTAVIMSGHSGNGAIWVDENTGKWTSSGYYSGTPSFIANKGRGAALAQKINGIYWRPLLSSDRYPLFNNSRKPFDFYYTYQGSKRDSYRNFRQSAPYNEEATDLAIEILSQSNPAAEGLPTGMLNVAYTAAPISFDTDGDNRLELMDTYVRLDAQIERLLAEIDRQVGLNNSTVFLVSSGYADDPAIPEINSKIPGGEFSYRKAESLLNSYLSATFGNGDFVKAINGNNILLDKKLIEGKRLNPAEIREQAKLFLLRMSGVSEAYTIDDIIRGDNHRVEDLSLTVDPKNAADLYIRFTPGWTVIDDTQYPEKSGKARHGSPLTPAFILSPSTTPKVVDGSIDVSSLAPTITSNLHIRAPNGASSKPLF